MNHAWHHFRKDVRQFRLLLCVWGVLLLANLAVNLGWLGKVAYHPLDGFEHDQASNICLAMLPGALWAGIALLSSLVILADSPARREGFLATRPLSKWDWSAAKAFFILLCIVAPWVLQEFIHLAGQGMPVWVIVQGTLERLMFALPVAFGFAAFAALWPGHVAWVRAAAILFAGWVLAAIGISLAIYFFHLPIPVIELSPSPVVQIYATALALVVLAAWHSRAHHGWVARWAGLVLALLLSFGAAVICPWPGFQLRPANPAAAAAAMAQAAYAIPLRDLSLQREQDTAPAAQPHFSLRVKPQIQSLPAGCMIEWSGKNARLMPISGVEIRGDGNPDDAPLFSDNAFYRTYVPGDFVAWAAAFPDGVLFQLGANNGLNEFEELFLGKFKVPAQHAEFTEPMAARASLEARVFQWRKLADLPLTPGAIADDEFGSWRLVAANWHAASAVSLVSLERRQITLDTAADSRCSSSQSGPLSRMVWMVYDPVRHLAWMPDRSDFSTTVRGSQTALLRHYLTLSFYHAIPPAEAARSRLIIFEKIWLGSVPETWQSHSFTLEDLLPPLFTGASKNQDPMPHPEFIRRVAALRTPSPDAPRPEVSLYLLQLLRLVEAQRNWLPDSDPVIAQLARFVPAHLDLLLDGLPAMNQTSQAAVIAALKQGATDAQKAQLIAALPKHPELAGVLLAHDWVADARPELDQLLHSPHDLPLDALRAIASRQDSNTYPRLLEEFAAQPSLAAAELLETLPGLEPQLKSIVSRQWRTRGLVLQNSNWTWLWNLLPLALHYGNPDALQKLYQVLLDPDSGEQNLSPITYNLANQIQMTGLKSPGRYNSPKVVVWLRQYRPEDFVYSPARHQFMLKPGAVAREITSVKTP